MLPLDEDEFARWFKSAEITLRSAASDHSSGFFNWSCFKSQQAAEFAIKAYLRGIGSPSYGHSISHLLKEAGFSSNLVDLGKVLDKYYIPTRYTDSWSEGVPEDYYTVNESNESMKISRKIIEAVMKKWTLLKKG